MSFPWRIPCHFMKWVGNERRGCSDESVFQDSQILCYIWVWSIDTGHGSQLGCLKEALLRTKLHSWAVRCNFFHSNLLVLPVLVDSVWGTLVPLAWPSWHSWEWIPFWMGLQTLEASTRRTGWASLQIREPVLVDSQCSSFPWFLFLLISLSRSSHCPCENRKKS